MSRRILVAAVLLAILAVSFFAGGPREAGLRAQSTNGGADLIAGTTNVAYLGPTMDLPAALTNAAASVVAVWRFDAFAPQGASPWQLWSASLSAPLQGFTQLMFGEAYFVVSDAAARWNFAGDGVPPVPTSVQLAAGGNNLVYFGVTLPVEQALDLQTAGLPAAAVASIWSLNAATWSLWNPRLPPALQGFGHLLFGAPYFITTTQPFQWQFPLLPPPQDGEPSTVQALVLLENYAATSFFPDPIVVQKGIPVRFYFARLHQEHFNRFAIEPFFSTSEVVLPGDVAVFQFLPDTAGSFAIKNLGHNFGSQLVVVDDAEAVADERAQAGLQKIALIYRLEDRTIFPPRVVVERGIPVRIYNLGLGDEFRVSVPPFYTATMPNVGPGEISTFEFTPDRTGTFIIRDALHGLETTLIVR